MRQRSRFLIWSWLAVEWEGWQPPLWLSEWGYELRSWKRTRSWEGAPDISIVEISSSMRARRP